MNSKSLFTVSFVVGFALILGLASIANAQDRIEPPADAHNFCINTITELAAGGITDDELMEIENVCVHVESAGLSYLETLMDNMNGDQPRPSFGTWAEAVAHMNRCRHVDDVICPNEGTVETPPVAEVPRTRRRLVVEARGPHRMEGRGWNRQVICTEGTEPVEVPWNRARSEGESRRRAEDGVTLVIIHCVDYSNPAAPPIAREEAEEDLEEVGNNYAFLTYYCSPNLPEGVVRDAAWAGFCNDFTRMHDDLYGDRGLEWVRSQIMALLTRMADAEAMLREICRVEVTDAEWARMSRADKVAACREARTIYERDSVGSGNGWHLRFHLGLAFHGLGITAPAGILAPHGVVYAELEALPVEHFGFFLRGYIGAGNLLDRIGQFNPDGTIGDEGIFGGSVGPTFRFNEMFALDVGLAASAVFNPGGQIGRSLHTWPVFQLGGEVRLRVNPLPWLHIEGTAGLDYSHAEVRRPNVDHFVGVDGVGYHLSLGAGVSF